MFVFVYHSQRVFVTFAQVGLGEKIYCLVCRVLINNRSGENNPSQHFVSIFNSYSLQHKQRNHSNNQMVLPWARQLQITRVHCGLLNHCRTKSVSMVYTDYSCDTEVELCFYGLHWKYKLKTTSIDHNTEYLIH